MFDSLGRGARDLAVVGDDEIRGIMPPVDDQLVVLLDHLRRESLVLAEVADQEPFDLAAHRQKPNIVDQTVDLRVREAPKVRHRRRSYPLGQDAEEILVTRA